MRNLFIILLLMGVTVSAQTPTIVTVVPTRTTATVELVDLNPATTYEIHLYEIGVDESALDVGVTTTELLEDRAYTRAELEAIEEAEVTSRHEQRLLNERRRINDELSALRATPEARRRVE